MAPPQRLCQCGPHCQLVFTVSTCNKVPQKEKIAQLWFSRLHPKGSTLIKKMTLKAKTTTVRISREHFYQDSFKTTNKGVSLIKGFNASPKFRSNADIANNVTVQQGNIGERKVQGSRSIGKPSSSSSSSIIPRIL